MNTEKFLSENIQDVERWNLSHYEKLDIALKIKQNQLLERQIEIMSRPIVVKILPHDLTGI